MQCCGNLENARACTEILCGGGRLGYYLAQKLSQNGVAVQLIEQDAARCRQLAGMLPDVSM